MDSNMIEYQVDEYGNQYWYLNGKWHSEDGPAVIWADGTKRWYLNGKRHREDGPAVIKANGDEEWWINGIQHDRISNKISFIINTNHNIKDGF